MSFARARGRYLAAMGITLAPFSSTACKDAPQPVVAPIDDGGSTTTTATATTTATMIATATASASATATQPDTTAHASPPHFPACPNGTFCVAEPKKSPAADAGAPTPYAMCSATAIAPEDVDSGAPPRRYVTFDAAGTKAARASDPKSCCYRWTIPCAGGRALTSDAREDAIAESIVAPLVAREDWVAAIDAVEVAALSVEERALLAAQWTREAAFEHASVASFARATLDLMSVGAPPEILADVQAAALDEIEHAKIAFALARAYGARDVGPGALPMEAIAVRAKTLAEVARDTFEAACVGESFGALVVRERARREKDAVVRALLDRIAADEERHAELAWRTIAWALRTGGDDVRAALADARARIDRDVARGDDAADAFRARAIREVVLPCVDALLA